MEKQALSVPTQTADSLSASEDLGPPTVSQTQHNQYLASFDCQHINCLLTLRKKEEPGPIKFNSPSKLASLKLEKEFGDCPQAKVNELLGEDDEDSSLIFRPVNKRKEQQEACLQETPVKSDKKSKALSFNPQKPKNRQFKISTRKSQQYQPEFQWPQSQNPANRTLPS